MSAEPKAALDNPLLPLLDEVRKALEFRLYYLAIMQCLAVPDICGAIGNPNGRAGPKQYKQWYSDYVWRNLILLTPDDCYSLRCGVIHQGQISIPGKKYKAIVFCAPALGAWEGSAMVDMGDYMALGIMHFCTYINNATHVWYNQKRDDPNVQKNAPLFFRPRPSDDKILGHTVIR